MKLYLFYFYVLVYLTESNTNLNNHKPCRSIAHYIISHILCVV